VADTGLTSTGFVPESIPDIRTGYEGDIRNTFSKSLPLGDETLLGHLLGILSETAGLGWERAEQIYSSQDPDKATGEALEALCLLTGTFREEATPSTVPLILCGDAGTSVAAGKRFQTVSTQKVFTNIDLCTLFACDVWVTATPYVVDDRVTNAGRCYQCITTGISSGGPTTTDADITDGTAHWIYIGEGTAAGDCTGVCEETGPVVAIAGDFDATSTLTPVGGLSSVRNIEDAELGADEQSDQSLRISREADLASSGASTKAAVRSAILEVDGVTSATVFVNNTDTTDVDGVPPHAFEALVRGGADQDILDTIAAQIPVGIASYGNTPGTVTDSEGTIEAYAFSRPTELAMYLRLFVEYDIASYPTDGDAQIKTLIATWGQGFASGKDADPSAAGAQAFGVDGVTGVPSTLIYTDTIAAPVAWAPTTAYVATPGSRSVVSNNGRYYICINAGTSAGSGGPTTTGTSIADGGTGLLWYWLGNKITITSRQLATFDTTRITINSSAVTP
jgi:uncharacterized phage protein gp47/JayE